MIKKVGIIDYGAGNLKSIAKALEIFDLQPDIVNILEQGKKLQISNYDLLILPGVGEFGSSMDRLNKTKDKIIEHIKAGKPLLGICLGIQLLFDKSEESVKKKGLGIFSGEVVKFKNLKLPVPHMCWNKVRFVNLESEKESEIKSEIVKNLNKEEFFYFVHSYYPVPKEKNIIFGTTVYDKNFCSMIVKDNIVATQFHLEKSGEKGLLLLKNIIQYFKKL